VSRCTTSLCQSVNTKLIKRTCEVVYDNGNIVNCHISELWLCNNCGIAFKPSVEKIAPWHLRFKTYRHKTKREISKTEIIKEFLR